MGGFGARALAQDDGRLGIADEAFGGVDELELGRVVHHGQHGGGPHLCGKHVAGHHLIAHFGVEIGAQERLLTDGFALGGAEFALASGVPAMAEFYQAGPEDVVLGVEHGEASGDFAFPKVGPACDGPQLFLVVDDAS